MHLSAAVRGYLLLWFVSALLPAVYSRLPCWCRIPADGDMSSTSECASSLFQLMMTLLTRGLSLVHATVPCALCSCLSPTTRRLCNSYCPSRSVCLSGSGEGKRWEGMGMAQLQLLNPPLGHVDIIFETFSCCHPVVKSKLYIIDSLHRCKTRFHVYKMLDIGTLSFVVLKIQWCTSR